MEVGEETEEAARCDGQTRGRGAGIAELEASGGP